MRVSDRSLAVDLPVITEVRWEPTAEDPREALWMGVGTEPPVRSFAISSPPRPATSAGYASLREVVSRLGREGPEADELAMLDSAARAQLTPRLQAVLEMAQVVERLLDMRDQATARLRAQGVG